jgi:hypothetical protein
MKGQVEVTFHWMYVLIAGGAFLLIFFFAMRSCTQATEERADTLQIRSAASTISLLAWQPRVNTSLYLKGVQVSCPAGTLTLSSGQESTPLDQIPAFLSPELDGDVQFITQDLAIETLPQIQLGNALYGIDQDTYYLIVRGQATNRLSEILSSRQVKQINEEDLASELRAVPLTAKAIVIASEHLPDDNILTISETAVYWVALQQSLSFYERQGQRFSQTGTASYAGDELAAGAVVAAKVQSYRCAAASVATRARNVLLVAQERSKSMELSQSCQPHHARVQAELDELAAKKGVEYLASALSSSTLKSEQRALYEISCPVIA